MNLHNSQYNTVCNAAGRHWVAMLAHELRSPLTAVICALNELTPLCEAEPTAQAARNTAEIGSRQMARIISDVLDMCRCATGQIIVRREWVDVSLIVAGAAVAAGPLITSRGHQLEITVPPNLPAVMVQPSHLEQVLTNLLTNAAKFTATGGTISLAVELTANMLLFRVRDNGVGIARDLMPHIFEAYRQGPARQDDAFGGLGIGLALVKCLLDLQGGEVSAHSDGPGTGAEFIVRLPTQRALEFVPVDQRLQC